MEAHAASVLGVGAGCTRSAHPDRMKLEKYCMTFRDVLFSSGVNCPS